MDFVLLHYPRESGLNAELLNEAALSRGIRLETWDPHRVSLLCSDNGIFPLYDGRMAKPRVLLHRTVAPFQGLLIPALEAWKTAGVCVLNDISSAYISRDKLLTTRRLIEAEVPVVTTLGFTESPPRSVSEMGSADPLIVKPALGLRGQGIRVFSSWHEMQDGWAHRAEIRPDFAAAMHYVVQPLVAGGGRDFRAFVVDGRCLGLIERTARPGEVRANLSLGSVATALPLTHSAAELATKALSACSLDYGGVDMLRDWEGTLRVLEVDAWAGFAGVQSATGVDIAGAIIDLALTRESGAAGR